MVSGGKPLVVVGEFLIFGNCIPDTFMAVNDDIFEECILKLRVLVWDGLGICEGCFD